MRFFNLVRQSAVETIDNFLASEFGYYVAQTFMRGYSPDYPEKRPILLTPYETPGPADDHLAHIYVDKYKALIDLANPKHCSKLQTMVLPNSPYLLYVATTGGRIAINLQDYKELEEALLKFIAARLKGSVDGLAGGGVFMNLRYGEFYLTLSLDKETISERLCVIEHCNLKESASTFPSQLILKL
jgi:hypothetical protein